MEPFDIEGVQYVKEPLYECRFGFGKKQRYDQSGQGNLTLGMEPVHESKIEMDGNQQAKFFSERNHPRVLQQPVATLHWGCNADFHRCLTNNIIYDQIISLGIPYRTFVERLLKLGLFGLEQFRAADNLIRYITSYNTKGNKSSANWTQLIKSIANDMCLGSDKTLRSVSFKFLVEVGKARSISRDEACFQLAGGLLSHNTFRVYKCSVSSFDLDDLTDVSESRNDTFKWHNIVRKYKESPDVLFPVSLFIFAASHFIRKNGSCVQVVPHFFGYDSKVSWPLQDDYSKWVLILHHPWIGNVESLKIDDSYVTALKAFLWSHDCPKLISMAILQKELGWKFDKSADLSMSRGHNGDTGALREDSQVTQGSNHQEAIDAAVEADN
jgi:hypothetical protein